MAYLSHVNLPNRYRKLSVIEQVTLFLFVAFVILTAVCNRLSIDDLFFKYRIDTVGLSGIIDNQYSRVMAYFLNGCIIATNSQVVLVLYNLISVFVFAYFLIKVLPAFLPAAYTEKNRFALLFFLFFFCCCSKPAEVFFWYTQVSTYLWCINCILIVVYFLQKGFRYSWQIPLFWLTCLFIGSSSEFLALQFLLLLVVYALWRKPVVPSEGKIIYIIGFVLLLISLAITLLSPGLETRSNLLATDGFGPVILSHIKFVLLYFKGFIEPIHLIFFGIFLSAFMALGMRSGNIWRPRLTEWAGFFAFVFITLLLPGYMLHDVAPARAVVICDLIGLFLLAKCVVYSGYLLKKQLTRSIRLIEYAGPVLWGAFALLFCIQHIRYADAYDKRENVIASSASNPIGVPGLPDCYFIQSCNITNNSNDFRNQHLKLSHHLSVEIVQTQSYRWR